MISPRFTSTPKTTLTYDLGGRQLTGTSELGHTATATYSAANEVLTVRDNLGNTATKTYDAIGNLRTVTDPLGKVTNAVRPHIVRRARAGVVR